jgi:hypothetical protein
VIRLSKQFLPGMSVGFDHPKTRVHVGDGFQFLKDYQNHFDVIITDSSDPEGPAESLFQKPYFELLNSALREGGVITTQGCTFPFCQNLLRSSRGGGEHKACECGLIVPSRRHRLYRGPCSPRSRLVCLAFLCRISCAPPSFHLSYFSTPSP